MLVILLVLLRSADVKEVLTGTIANDVCEGTADIRLKCPTAYRSFHKEENDFRA